MSDTGAISGRRIEEQKHWRVARGLLGKVSGELTKATSLMRALATTAGQYYRGFPWGGEGGGAGSAVVGGVVDGAPYGPGARASVRRGQTPISGNR